jgi:predicted nucleotidyltransferase
MGKDMTLHEKETMIETMRDVIVATIAPCRIVLFGSYANGNATERSDADFLVIEEKAFGPGRSRRKEAAKVWTALLPFSIAKDILVYSLEEVKQVENNPFHVVNLALKTGKILYDKT